EHDPGEVKNDDLPALLYHEGAGSCNRTEPARVSDFGDSDLAHVVAGVQPTLENGRVDHSKEDAIHAWFRRFPAVLPERPDRRSRRRRTDRKACPRLGPIETDRQTIDGPGAAP